MEQRYRDMLRNGAEKVWRFLRSTTNREILTFLFFAFISAGFWLLETLNDDYERVISIPVEYANLPDNVVITSEVPNELRATVIDKGFMQINYLWGRSGRPVVIDFHDYETQGNSIEIGSNELQKQLLRSLESSTKLISFKPEQFEFVYTRGQAKKVPVRLRGNITSKQQYDVTKVNFIPDSLVIYAPQDILDTIHVVFTQPLSYHELDDTLVVEADMQRMQNVKITPSRVTLEVCVSQLTQKTIEVPIQPINVPKGKIVHLFPSKVKATFQTVLSNFDKINPEEFSIKVDFDQMDTKSEKCKPVVTNFPSTIKYLKLQPAEVEFLVEDE